MDSISNGPKVPDVEMAGLRHCNLRLYGDGVSALATDPAESAVRPSRVPGRRSLGHILSEHRDEVDPDEVGLAHRKFGSIFADSVALEWHVRTLHPRRQ